MKNEAKNTPFNVILVAICVFVGVGFISGAEIWFYFARFGKNMLFGLICFAVLSFLLVFYSMSDDKVFPIGIRRLKMLILFFGELLIGSAMVSGLLQVSRQLFGACWLIVFLISIFVMIFVFLKGMKSTIIYNYFVALFIIFVIVSLFLFGNNNNVYYIDDLVMDFNLKNALFSSVFACVYIFMNIAEIRPIIERFKYGNKLKNRFFFSLFFSLILILLVFILSCFLIINPKICSKPMPFLLLFNNTNTVIKFIFLCGLILAMVSTAVACLVGMVDKLNTVQNDEKFNQSLVILSLLILGQIPFWFFIRIIYPIVGIFNLLVFVIEIIYRSKKV